MSLNFDVSAIENHETITTAYRNYRTGMNYDASSVVREEKDGEITRYFLLDVDDGEEIEVARIWHPVTEVIIWRCMAVGLGEITEENVEEFYLRSKIVDTLFGEALIMHGEKASLSLEQLRQHIGLTTNVGNEKYNPWLKRQMERYREDLERNLRYKKENASVETAS
jgi:hypothetical protein